MRCRVEIQNMSTLNSIPDKNLIIKWAEQAVDDKHHAAELTVRIVDEEEGQRLNKKWRKKDRATNVLSFPAGEMIDGAPDILGDIVICAPVVELEAKQQGKTITSHWAHLIIHGVLHLQGYDHASGEEADIMESREIKILHQIGISNPYQID